MGRQLHTRRQRERFRKGELGDLCWLCLPGETKRRQVRDRIGRRELAEAKRAEGPARSGTRTGGTP